MGSPYAVGLMDGGDTSLQTLGGKGANLARLAREGFPVPPAYVITTHAYRDAVLARGTDATIREALATFDTDDLEALDGVSQRIRAQFSTDMLPEKVAGDIARAYSAMGCPPVAVRSSATAEDLPGLSFAGLHDTRLNVTSVDQLLEAVVECWASLWSARAIAYRARQGVGQAGLAMAVVVQEMAQAEASGVLFTANPLTGQRNEAVVDAVLGLGESLVSGQVEPDRYAIDRRTGIIARKALGAKAVSVLARPDGGTYTTNPSDATRQAVSDDVILELATLGERIEEVFDGPQDIEWTWSASGIQVLQSRPITSLFPVPDSPQGDLRVFFSFAAVQGMLDPITPLGQDTVRGLFGGLAGLFGGPVAPEQQRLAFPAGERLWIDASAALRNAVGRRMLLRAFSLIEPGIASAVREALHDPRLSPTHRLPHPKALLRVARGGSPLAARFAAAQIAPQWSRRRAERAADRLVERFRARFAAAKTLSDVVETHEALMELGLRTAVVRVTVRLFAGLAAFALLRRLAHGKPDGDLHALEVTRALPHNPTTQMDMALWETSRLIASDAEADAALTDQPAETLASPYSEGKLPPAAQQALTAFLDRYGMRGIGEIDIGQTRWTEDSTPVIETIQEYLRLDDPDRFPPTVFEASGASARAAVGRIETAVRHGPLGALKAGLVRQAARRVRELAGLRETPKFMVVRLLGMSRAALLAKAEALVEAGVIARPDDIFYLRMSELRGLGTGGTHDYRALVAKRRQAYERERRRRRLPLVLLSDGRAFYGAARHSAEGDGLSGTPVSPGVVEGNVRVVLDPKDAALKAGEVLVCPGTDPAWTPLFLVAGGLVTEVGGLMTHGSVLAREYGIPAVVGIADATSLLKTGQRVRVDGSTGQVTILT